MALPYFEDDFVRAEISEQERFDKKCSVELLAQELVLAENRPIA